MGGALDRVVRPDAVEAEIVHHEEHDVRPGRAGPGGGRRQRVRRGRELTLTLCQHPQQPNQEKSLHVRYLGAALLPFNGEMNRSGGSM